MIVPLQSLAPWNPLQQHVWLDVDSPITCTEVKAAIEEGRLRDDTQHFIRRHHIERIAWFVVHGWEDSIEIDVGVPSMGCCVDWINQDGNHRLAAAFYRKDDTIKVSISGSIDYAEELFSISGLGRGYLLP